MRGKKHEWYARKTGKHATSTNNFMVRVFIFLTLLAIALEIFITPTLAANDPGHDTLYILRGGDNVTGNYKIIGNLNVTILYDTDGGAYYLDLSGTSNLNTLTLNNDLAIAHGGTGASDAATARANLLVAANGSCGVGQVVQNTTTGGVQCITPVGTTYSNGSGLTLVGTQFNHSDTSSQSSSDNSGRTYIQDILLDTFGHITSVVTATETVVDTNDTVALIALTTKENANNNTQSAQINALITNDSTINSRLLSVNSSLYNNITVLSSRESANNATQASLISARALPGSCGVGQVVQNTTTGGVQCITVGAGNVTSSAQQDYIPLMNTTTILSNSVIYQNGSYIGIGKTNPVTTLDVNGYFRVGPSGSVDGGRIHVYGTLSDGWYSGITLEREGGYVGKINVALDGFLFRNYNNTVFDFRNGSDASLLVINYSGNVGIGVSNPTHKLQLANHTTSSGGIGFGTDVELYRSAADTLSLASGDSLNIVSGALQVAGTDVVTSGRIIRSADGSTIAPSFSWSGDSNVGLYRPAADTIGFITNSAERVRISSTGLIGVGTTNPTAAIHTNYSGASILAENPTNNKPVLYVNANTEKVGVLTNTPQQTLEVAGNIQSDSIILDNGGVHFNTTTSKPTCSVTYRGLMWYEQGATNVADKVYACMKNSTNAYNWVQIAIG